MVPPVNGEEMKAQQPAEPHDYGTALDEYAAHVQISLQNEEMEAGNAVPPPAHSTGGAAAVAAPALLVLH